MDILSKINAKTTGIFAAGVVFGTAGIKLLSSRDAKKAYTHGVAAVLRVKESVMKTVTNIQENAEDIYAEARQINEERDVEEPVFEDESEAGEGGMEGSEYMEVTDAQPQAVAE